mmetsp:Transcript_29213/g.64410  ORF Transcript_29213/g.64410 Transcript_29213/m.64410 type:complete len:248 (+) Transcript_29213:143-886(+)
MPDETSDGLTAFEIAAQATAVAEKYAENSDDRADGVILVGEDEQKPSLSATPEELKKLLDVIENDIMPETEKGVAAGNKVFGAAILRNDLTCDLASTNTETDCPLFHGEVKCIYDWSKKIPASERGPRAQTGVFLATHEPCCMCVASILWTGFNRIFYFLPYSTTTAQGIPHDINTMHELWGVNSYRKRNKYFSSACIQELIDALDDGEVKTALQEQSGSLLKRYNDLAAKYHTEKATNDKNSLVLG